jgi:hypothetical protein
VLKKRSDSIWGPAAIGILALAVFTVEGFGTVVPRSVPATSGSAASSSSAIAVTFTDVIKSSGITFKQDSTQTEEKHYLETMGTGVAWLDDDQDGLMDLFFVQSAATDIYKPPHPLRCALYHNNGDGTFTDVTAKAGVGSEGLYGQGVAVGDFDNDGYPDLNGMGYMSASDPRIHFGLGQRTKADSLDITWPSGQVDRLSNVPIDRIIAVKEDTGIVPRDFPKIVNPKYKDHESSPSAVSRLLSFRFRQHSHGRAHNSTLALETQFNPSIDGQFKSTFSGAVRGRSTRSWAEHSQRLGRDRSQELHH